MCFHRIRCLILLVLVPCCHGTVRAAAAPIVTMDDLVAQVRAPGEARRAKAAALLARVGKAAHPSLICLSRDKEAAVRYHALAALRGMGREAEAARCAVIWALRDEDGEVRYLALRTLPQLGHEPERLVPLLLAAERDEDDDVRFAAREELQRLGKRAVPALVRAMKSPDTREQAAGYLVAHAKEISAAGFGSLLQLLQTSPPRTVSRYIDANQSSLWHASTRGRIDALVEINRLIFHRRKEVRLALVDVLGMMTSRFDSPPFDPEIVEVIVSSLDGKRSVDAELRKGAKRLSLSMYAAASLVLARMLRDDDEDVREEVCASIDRSLVDGDDRAELLGGALRLALDDPNYWVRSHALEALKKLGDSPLALLRKRAEHGDRRERVRAATLLSNLDPASAAARAVLLDAVAKSEGEERAQAATALLSLGEAPKGGPLAPKQQRECLTALAASSKAKRSREQLFALRVFRLIGQQSAPFVPAILDTLGSPDPRVRMAAVSALRMAVQPKFGPYAPQSFTDSTPPNPGWYVRPDAKTTLPRLAKLLDDPNAEVRLEVIRALETFGADAVHHLARALRDPDHSYPAFDILFQMRDTAKAAAPILRRSLRDPAHAEIAARILQSMDARGNHPALVKWLGRSDPRVEDALKAAGGAGPTPKVTILRLVKGLKSAEVEKRVEAAHALCALGRILTEEDSEYFLEAVTPRLKDDVPDLCKDLASKDVAIRRMLIDELIALRNLNWLAHRRYRVSFSNEAGWATTLDDLLTRTLRGACDDADPAIRQKARKAIRVYLHPPAMS